MTDDGTHSGVCCGHRRAAGIRTACSKWRSRAATRRRSSSICAVGVAILLCALAALCPVAALAESCSNEELRAETHSLSLPDCRAYELVTPAFKNLSLVTELLGSSDGSAITFASFAGHGEGVQPPYETASTYRSARTASGWVTTALAPPATELEVTPTLSGNEPLGATDAGDALVSLRPAEGSVFEDDLYLRQANGALVEVGPMLPLAALPPSPSGEGAARAIAAFGGASADLSHVLFQLPYSSEIDDFWPGDVEVNNNDNLSLYEYIGANNAAPALVGVDDSGHQISQCGTGLGANTHLGEFASVHNAVSSSGMTVFFTAAAACPEEGGAGPPANELFARIDGAHTVAISEPSAADCSACRTETPSNATFVGASRDGAKVFFVTDQSLLPSDTDATPDLYEYDFSAPAGQRIIQASGGDASDATPGTGAQVVGVGSSSEDGSHVYFVAQGVLTTEPNLSLRPGHQAAEAGSENLYLYERDSQFPAGRTVFVATLPPSDAGEWGLTQESPMETTPEGRFLVFTSSADLTPDDTSVVQQVFRYDAESGELLRVSIDDPGFNSNGNAGLAEATVRPPKFASQQIVNQDPNPAITNDGSVVLFTSSDRLTPQAQEDAPNVYVYERGRVFLISDGRAPAGSFVQGVQLGPSGADVLFRTPDSLVAQDTDVLSDIYDARIGGGFPAPAAPLVCSGEGCQGSISAPPVNGAPSSATFAGAGNITPPVPVEPKQLTRAQKLAKALNSCRKYKSKSRRRSCEKKARKQYGLTPKVKAKRKGGK
jgi:hypothetical protein